MRTSSFFRAALLPLVGSFLWAACGSPGFEPASKVKGLRVLALQKEPPYPHPGETVDLKLLYWDGKTDETAPRKVQFNFFQCDNPPGDLYYACFANKLMPLSEAPAPVPDAGSDAAPLADASEDVADASDDVADAIDIGDASADATPDGGSAPSDDARIVTKRITIPSRDGFVLDRDPTDYGLRYVFFTACAGHLGAADPGSANGLPIGCFDDMNQKLGPDDFVPGYSSLYVYDELRNANPVLNSPSLVIDEAAKRVDGVPHVMRCTASDRSACPAFTVKADVSRESAERDPEAKDANGNPLLEQLWVAYYSTDGDFTNSLRLVNDATTGFNDDHGTKFRAPPTPGTVHLFGVVHDNRGGVVWALGKVIVD
jgi:hypothetical protein